jgi:hypothetical protein
MSRHENFVSIKGGREEDELFPALQTPSELDEASRRRRRIDEKQRTEVESEEDRQTLLSFFGRRIRLALPSMLQRFYSSDTQEAFLLPEHIWSIIVMQSERGLEVFHKTIDKRTINFFCSSYEAFLVFYNDEKTVRAFAKECKASNWLLTFASINKLEGRRRQWRFTPSKPTGVNASWDYGDRVSF